jgi:23S rRNA (cytosine1962-C5)-methyltransferase
MAASLRLKKDQERRLRAGHCWVYSNEIDVEATPLKGFTAGDPVALISSRGKWLAWGYVNPNSLICARVVSRDREHALDRSLIVHRLKMALGLRQRLYAEPFYRLVFGESDGLPGLVVDRYGDLAVVQITTAGMEVLREEVVSALEKVLKPSAILLRNDSGMRELEGLDSYVESALGVVPERVELSEGGARFQISPASGQKTGWYFDQARNRERLLPYLRGRLRDGLQGGRMLDVCSYVGAWGVCALSGGAAQVVAVDTSEKALAMAELNADLNGFAASFQTRRGDAFATLKALKEEGERFDFVVLDPPAFVKRKKDLRDGTQAYRRLNEAAMSLLNKEGFLVSASCSYHMDRDGLLRTIQQAARHMDRSLQVLEQGQQGQDHPVHPAIPETAYLKAFYLRVLPSF